MPTLTLSHPDARRDALTESDMQAHFGETAVQNAGQWFRDCWRADQAGDRQKVKKLLAQKRRLDAWKCVDYLNHEGEASTLLKEYGFRQDDLDSLATVMERALTIVEPTLDIIEDDRYPLASGNYVPFDTEIDPAANRYEFHQVQSFGKIQRGSPRTSDILDQEVVTRPFVIKGQQYWGGYMLQRDDLMAIARANTSSHLKIDLAKIKRESLHTAVMAKEHELVAWGDGIVGMPGIINHPKSLVIVSDTAISENSTPKTILSILNRGARIARRIAKERRQYVQPDCMFLPPSIREILEDLMYTQENTGTTGLVTNSKSVMQHFRDSNDWIEDIKELEELEADVLAAHGLPHAPRILFTSKKPLPSGKQPLRFFRNQPFMMLQPKEIGGWGGMAFAGTMRIFGNILLREQALTTITFPES